MHDHFKGKSAAEHLQEARMEGFLATAELHGYELSGARIAGLDALVDVSVILAVISRLTFSAIGFVAMAGFVLIVWKSGRSAILAWSRLERLHRLVQEEKKEIEDNREQEREELTALYKARGFEGDLLKQVIDTMMADDERLLRIMLEEELKIPFDTYEHPITQGLGAGLGALGATCVASTACFLPDPWNAWAFLPVVAVAAWVLAKAEKNRPSKRIVWTVGLAWLTPELVHIIGRSL